MKTRLPVRRILGTTLFLLGLNPTLAAADEMSYRAVSYSVKNEVKPVGDVDGHVAGAFARRGLAFFKGGPADAEVAVFVNVGTTERTKEGGKTVCEFVFTFEDGSSFRSNNVTEIRVTPDGKRSSIVRSEISDGTGRFARIKGTGTGSGKLVTPDAGETKGDGYFDGAVTYTIPKPGA